MNIEPESPIRRRKLIKADAYKWLFNIFELAHLDAGGHWVYFHRDTKRLRGGGIFHTAAKECGLVSKQPGRQGFVISQPKPVFITEDNGDKLWDAYLMLAELRTQERINWNPTPVKLEVPAPEFVTSTKTPQTEDLLNLKEYATSIGVAYHPNISHALLSDRVASHVAMITRITPPKNRMAALQAAANVIAYMVVGAGVLAVVQHFL